MDAIRSRSSAGAGSSRDDTPTSLGDLPAGPGGYRSPATQATGRAAALMPLPWYEMVSYWGFGRSEAGSSSSAVITNAV